MQRAASSLLLAGLFLSAVAWGQGLSTVNGRVTDPSDSVVAGAVVTVTEVETSVQRTTVANADGLYTVSGLRPTTYTIKVEARGFRTVARTGITLLANDVATVNLKLELGATSDTVTVEAAASQVDTSTATLRQVVDSARIIDLPLNGRNAATLTTLVAGAVIAPANDSDEGATKTFPVAVTVSINGGHGNQTSYSLDGVPNTDFLSNINLPFPMPDALQEFSVQTNNYSAEYGQNVGGVVNIITRSGSNSFHGDAFGFLRNAVFNARNFFSATRDPLKRDQYGASLGGPAIRNKLFFFFGYQGTRIRSQQGGLSAFVPTAADLSGDFSAFLSASDPNNPLRRAVPIKDPTTNLPFPGNLIPTSEFDPASIKMTTTWLPPATGNGLIFYSVPIAQDLGEYTTKEDYNISNSDRLAFRYFRDSFDQPAHLTAGNLITYADYTDYVVQNALVQETHIFTPNLLNDFRFGVMRETDLRGPPANTPNVKQFGVNIWQGAVPAIESTFSVSGFFSFGGFPQGYFPRAGFTWADTVRYVHGRHNLSFGGSFERDRLNEFTATNSSGVFAFSGDTTGSALPDFMLGRMRTFTQGNGYVQANRYSLFSLFAQDTFKVSPRLSLNFGLRWEPSLPWHDKYHEAEAFFPQLYAQGVHSQVYPGLPPGVLVSGDAGMPEDGRRPNWDNISPRVGFAYDLTGNGKTSLRGGVGIFYDSRVPGFANNRQSQATPFSLAVTMTSPVGPFSNPYQGITNPFPAPLPPAHDTVFPQPVLIYSWSPSDRLSPITYNANVAVEHQLASSWLVRVAYVGARAIHVNVNVQENPAIYIPGSSLSTDARRAFKGFTSMPLASSAGNSWYNAMQTSLEKRLSRGFTLLVNYTWSKSVDNIPLGEDAVTPGVSTVFTMPPTTPNYQMLDRGPSDFNHASVLSSSYVWHLPDLAHSTLFLRGVAGGWELHGIISAQSGGPLTILAGTDRSLTGIGYDKGNMVAGQAPYLGGPCATVAPCVNYLNLPAFAAPPTGTFGTLAKGTFTGPGAYDWDTAMAKTFTIKERVKVQFRAEFFNVLNHARFSNPSATISAAAFGTIRAAADPRIGQMALKVTF